jgi:hypothetical protein
MKKPLTDWRHEQFGQLSETGDWMIIDNQPDEISRT